MDGLRVNAKEKLVGFHSVILKEGNGSSQAKWQKCSRFFLLGLVSYPVDFVRV